ncbi:unnamed protein product [Urochloa humidicola]
MDLRAVCQHWRSSTADPRTSHDARFRPTRWIVLYELSSESDTRLFVNADTGRFLRRRLLLLRDYHFVTSTTGGFLVQLISTLTNIWIVHSPTVLILLVI